MGIQIAFDLIHHFYMESFNKETFILSSKRATKRIFSWSIGIHNKNTVFLTRQTIWTVLLADIKRNSVARVFLNQTKYFLWSVLIAHYLNIPTSPKNTGEVSDVNGRLFVCANCLVIQIHVVPIFLVAKIPLHHHTLKILFFTCLYI